MSVEEQRRSSRVRTILGALALPGKGLPPVPCQVRDLSDEGARITIDEKAMLPDHFELHVAKRNVARPARVCWRQGAMLGVAFLDSGAEQPDPAARLKALEAENADLRRRVVELTDRLYSYGFSGRDDAL